MAVNSMIPGLCTLVTGRRISQFTQISARETSGVQCGGVLSVNAGVSTA